MVLIAFHQQWQDMQRTLTVFNRSPAIARFIDFYNSTLSLPLFVPLLKEAWRL